MSVNETEDIKPRYDTKPTLETLLEELRAGFAAVDKRFNAFDSRLDRIESVVNITRGEMLELRADFREMCAALKEQTPATR